MTPINATCVVSSAEIFETAPLPGVYYIGPSGRYILFECPCGCGAHIRLPIYEGDENPTPGITAWKWNGNRVQPSLFPSIRDMNACRFHGHLTNGVWTFEGDSGVKS